MLVPEEPGPADVIAEQRDLLSRLRAVVRPIGARTTRPAPSTPPVIPTTPAPSRPPKPSGQGLSAGSSLTACSAPAAPPCLPPSSPPPTPRPPRTSRLAKQGSRRGSPGSRPRRTPRSWNWKIFPPIPPTRPDRLSGPGSAPGSPNCTKNANASRPSSRLWPTLPRRRPTPACWTGSRWPGTSCPGSPRLKARLCQVFDITVLWNKPGRRATVTAEITEATLQALIAILDPGQDGFHDTAADQPEPVGHLANTPRTCTAPHSCNPPRGQMSGGRFS